MNRGQKEITVEGLKHGFESSNGSFLVRCKGMTVADMQSLRKELRPLGGTLKVAKGRLVKIAIKDVPGVQDLTPFVKEQLAVVFASQDPNAVAKALYGFSKKAEALALVVGYVDAQVCEKDMLVFLATLPSREVLLAQLCGLLQTPISQFARALDQIAQQKKSVE